MRIAAASGKSAAKRLIGIFEGISPILAREWLFRACGSNDITTDELDSDTLTKLIAEIMSTRDDYLSGRRKYTILTDNDGNLKDFCFIDITQYGRTDESLRPRTTAQGKRWINLLSRP